MIKKNQQLAAIARHNEVFTANYTWQQEKQIEIAHPVYTGNVKMGTCAKMNVSRVYKAVRPTTRTTNHSENIAITKVEAQQQVSQWLTQGAIVQNHSDKQWVIYNPEIMKES